MPLIPYPLGALVRRAFRELDARGSAFDLPARRFVAGDPSRDMSVAFHGRRAAAPFGPAAGPHSQLAQNIALAWLAGARVIELKTVQVRDDLVIPRPCIDMQTVGYNVEWSQELKIAESLDEYVKAAILVRVLEESGRVPLAPGFGRTLFDMSVGYDLAGITSDKVQTFIAGMRDAGAAIDRLRRDLPAEIGRLRDVDVDPVVSDTLTLSTFHGCPPDEIERIVSFLLERCALNVVVKLNPTLLGPDDTRAILHDRLGYTDIVAPRGAFDRDTTWPQMCDFVGRLADRAAALGLGFGVKFTNTLIVENHRSFFPVSEREMYLSGPPLHVLAIELVRKFRRVFGHRVPVSFSAGIDNGNYPDAVALGFVPVTACTDLLKPGGYGRAKAYADRLAERMAAADAANIDEFVLRAYGLGRGAIDRLSIGDDERGLLRHAWDTHADLRAAAGADALAEWIGATVCANTEQYADAVLASPRYAQPQNTKPPRKIGSHLRLFDCITCDKCVPVCPNDAIFTFVPRAVSIPRVVLRRTPGGWTAGAAGEVAAREPHQIGVFADFCNECGNCDVFCPEDGGPYVMKPRFFSTAAAWRDAVQLDGLFIGRDGADAVVLGRAAGREYRVELPESGGRLVRFSGEGFAVTLDPEQPAASFAVEAGDNDEIDLTWCLVLLALRKGVLAPDAVNFVAAMQG